MRVEQCSVNSIAPINLPFQLEEDMKYLSMVLLKLSHHVD